MYHYEYVTKKQAATYRKELIEIIKMVQDEVRDDFTFQFTFIGSSRRNMITLDPTTNIGFDFDVNIEVNVDTKVYTPLKIRTILRSAFTRISRQYDYDKCEDSTRVLTIKTIDPWHSRISHSCDIAIVYERDSGQQYIRYNKETRLYTWEKQEQMYNDLEKRAEFLKKRGHWGEVRDVYLSKKNSNDNPNKRSRSLYAETINECYRRHHE